MVLLLVYSLSMDNQMYYKVSIQYISLETGTDHGMVMYIPQSQIPCVETYRKGFVEHLSTKWGVDPEEITILVE